MASVVELEVEQGLMVLLRNHQQQQQEKGQ